MPTRESSCPEQDGPSSTIGAPIEFRGMGSLLMTLVGPLEFKGTGQIGIIASELICIPSPCGSSST